MTDAAKYGVPSGHLGLKGPMTRPDQGTLPIRGDLAHIALADRHLVAHYVVPNIGTIGGTAVALKLSTDAESETLAELAAGSTFEVLDFVGDWCWGCVGPDGPTGYIAKDALISGTT